VGIFAQLGDLAESLLKRTAGVKEAGTLIPGHGGILDRLDSVVFTLPLVYYFVALVWKV
jgi:phosphatidate cytidylyltransferase